MDVLWIGGDLYKGYHDPATGVLDLLASRSAEEGGAFSVPDFVLAVDDEGAFCHLGLDVGEGSAVPLPERPAKCGTAVEAEVELVESARPRWNFDAPNGSLRLGFEGVDALEWARMGDNLLWLALDEEHRLAAIVFEGVSRDPGGKGQATWLEEVGIDGGMA